MISSKFKMKKCAFLVFLVFCKFSYAQFINGTDVTVNNDVLNGSLSAGQLSNNDLLINSFSSSSSLIVNNTSLSINTLTMNGYSDYESNLTLENNAILNVTSSAQFLASNPGIVKISVNSGSSLNLSSYQTVLGGPVGGKKEVLVIINGSGSSINSSGAFIVGNDGGNYNIIVENGGQLNATGIRMQGLWRVSNLVVKGLGSSVRDYGTTEVSINGSMKILDGAVVTSNIGLISGDTIDTSEPHVLVSGTGSTWEILNDLSISHPKKYSYLAVEDGGVIKANAINARSKSMLSGGGTFETTNGLTLYAGSIIEPGYNSVAHKTLSVTGDLIFETGSIYNVSGNEYSNDRINVTGNATLTGGVANVVADGASFLENHRYIILKASSLVGTKFSDVTTNYAFLDALLGYDNTDVYFELKRNNNNYWDYALTPNQKSTAVALSKMDRKDLLDEYVETVSKSEAPNAFDLLSGEIHASLRSSLLNWSSSTGQSSLEQLRVGLQSSDDCTSGEKSKLDLPQQKIRNCIDTSPITGWAQVIGNWRQTSSDGNAAKSKASTGGLLLGADYGNFANGWRVGAMFGYGMTDDKSNARRSSAKLHNYTLGLHAGKRFDRGAAEHVNVMGGLSYTHHSIKTERNIPRIDQQLQAKYSANTIQAFGEVGYAMAPVGKWLLEPFVGLNISKQKVGSFEENGGFAGVHSRAESKTYTTTTLGLHAQSDLEVSGKPVKVRGTVGLKQALGNKEVTRTMVFNVGSPDYLIWGVPRASSTLVLGAQAQMALSPAATLEAGFSGEFGSKVREQTIQARVRWAF